MPIGRLMFIGVWTQNLSPGSQENIFLCIAIYCKSSRPLRGHTNSHSTVSSSSLELHVRTWDTLFLFELLIQICRSGPSCETLEWNISVYQLTTAALEMRIHYSVDGNKGFKNETWMPPFRIFPEPFHTKGHSCIFQACGLSYQTARTVIRTAKIGQTVNITLMDAIITSLPRSRQYSTFINSKTIDVSVWASNCPNAAQLICLVEKRPTMKA